jgi:hypothetical protein
MDRVAEYLRIPSVYATGLNGLRWSSAGDAVEFADGRTFAFRPEIFQFLEGFAWQRSLIHFGYILHLMYLLRYEHTPFLGRRVEKFRQAYEKGGRHPRNAGVFCAILCDAVPAVPDPPLTAELLERMYVFSIETAADPGTLSPPGEAPPLPPEVFESRVLYAISSYDFVEMLHWFRHGRGPVTEAAEEIAQTIVLNKPRSLKGVLAELAQRQRLCGAVPFVDQLVSALTLPPRRLERPELPLGGYSDLSTRGQVEQILPSQFALDDLEFVSRHAERELLYFRREEPHVHTREELVVLLDQGVRTWGSVRLVLTAALFALGQLAERRRIPFVVSATSAGGSLLDPLQIPTSELQEWVEASDLSPHPGAALERVLTDETNLARDVVLLTHPRNLGEPEVQSAAGQVAPDARLFAVTVDEHGEVRFSMLVHGQPVCRSRFHVDLERNTPPPALRTADPLACWRGAVEKVPFPFRFGTAGRSLRFAFDAAGEWLLTATQGGMLYATRTDGSGGEILPRGLVRDTVLTNVTQVIGVAGGFVVTSEQPGFLIALHYDFRTRTCTAHEFARNLPPSVLPTCFYLRKLHTLVVPGSPKTLCVHLTTGSRDRPAAAHSRLDSRVWGHALPVQGEGEPRDADAHWSWPQLFLDSDSGTLELQNVVPAWESFTPLEDNQPVLKGRHLVSADCQGHTLAALFTKPNPNELGAVLRLFRGPRGIPLAAFPQPRDELRFALSNDGRLLAQEVGRAQVEIRDVLAGGPPRHVTSVGRFHSDVKIELGDRWLILQIDKRMHLIRWDQGSLILQSGRQSLAAFRLALMQAGLANGGLAALPSNLPSWMRNDAGNRYLAAACGRLLAVLDRFGEVALFEHSGELVCMFFAFRLQIAAWMPDGTCYGPPSLLDRPVTPGALDKIGAALCAAWERGGGKIG